MTTVAAAVAAAGSRLAAAGVPTPDVDARWLVCHVLGLRLLELVLRGARALTAEEAAGLDAVVARREAREPLQLILGTVAFRHLEIVVRPGVFVPRPETEVLAGLAIERVTRGATVVEPCTGTGAVALAIGDEADRPVVIATDVSPEAVALAEHNIERLDLPLVEVHQGDLLSSLDDVLRGEIDMIVSNPPYLASSELPAVEPEVRDWDPAGTLVSGPTGHEVSDRLLDDALVWLRPGGWLLLEVDTSRAAECASRASARGLRDVVVEDDLTGRPRFVFARR